VVAQALQQYSYLNGKLNTREMNQEEVRMIEDGLMHAGYLKLIEEVKNMKST
jgi:hypothetical protein